MELPSDAELMARVREGDQQSLAGIITRYQDSMVNYLSRLTGCHARAEDLAQEVFLRLYLRSESYTEMGRLSGYLYRIATNLVRSEQRRDRRRRFLQLAFLSGGNGASPPPGPQASLLGGEAQEQITRALTRLPLRYRVPLVLHLIEDLSYQEIARVVGCKPGTVKSRISRGRQALKEKLSGYYQGGAP